MKTERAESRNAEKALSRTFEAPNRGREASWTGRAFRPGEPGRIRRIPAEFTGLEITSWPQRSSSNSQAIPMPPVFRTGTSAGTPEEQRAAAASHLAHDARNWLTVLQVYCDLLRSSGAVAGHGRTWIEDFRMRWSADRDWSLRCSIPRRSRRRRNPPLHERHAAGPKHAGPGGRHQTQRAAVPADGREHDPSGKSKLWRTPRPRRCRKRNSIASC